MGNTQTKQCSTTPTTRKSGARNRGSDPGPTKWAHFRELQQASPEGRPRQNDTTRSSSLGRGAGACRTTSNHGRTPRGASDGLPRQGGLSARGRSPPADGDLSDVGPPGSDVWPWEAPCLIAVQRPSGAGLGGRSLGQSRSRFVRCGSAGARPPGELGPRWGTRGGWCHPVLAGSTGKSGGPNPGCRERRDKSFAVFPQKQQRPRRPQRNASGDQIGAGHTTTTRQGTAGNPPGHNAAAA